MTSKLRTFNTKAGDFPPVVITAIDMTTSLGTNTEDTWQALLDGKSGIKTLEREFLLGSDDPLPVTIGGEFVADPTDELDRIKRRRMSYVEMMAFVMGKRLWSQIGEPDVDKGRLGVALGTGLGGGEAMVEAVDAMRDGGYRKVSPLAVQKAMPNGAAGVVGLELGAQAGVMTSVSACSSSNEAIAHAWRHIVLGEADMMIAGGVEGRIEAVPIACFSMMRAMSTRNDEPARASRPFDRDRDGFVFGEAAALMVIETEEHALARGAKPIARLLGAGITSDAYHIVATDPEGAGAARAMQRAMDTAGITAEDVDHINAHATSTPIGDISEAKAIHTVLGEHSASVYAPKSALGHSIGAVGALEACITALSIRDEIVPPTLNLENVDEGIDLDVVHTKARPGRIDYALNNSFGFGGHNVALALGRY